MTANHCLTEIQAREILGLRKEHDAESIRRSYLEKIKMYPPDQDPKMFEQIRDAYETLRVAQDKQGSLFADAAPGVLFADLLDPHDKKRYFTGPEPWLRAIAAIQQDMDQENGK